jgi:site-specific DNA recombinase
MKQNGKPRSTKEQVSSKKLRFAALRRVSTEQQEKTGESLRTQTKDIEELVSELGGVIVGWFGGQEHATPGHEKKEVSRLLQDAQKQPCKFDAVIVAHPDRWSRDNSVSRQGLEVFRDHGIRFFAGATEYDLFNPDHEMYLGISAVIGQFQSRNQMRKSLINRINRAKRGIPTCGKLPFGRIFVRSENGQTGHWDVDPEKQKIIQDCAKRYLAGEGLEDLANEYRVNMTNLHKVLTKVSGTKWEIRFASKVLNIDEIVSLEIPRLLPDKIIAAIRARCESNRTFTRGHIKYQYLFSRIIRCAHCGYAMFGQTNHNKHRYYRHAHATRVRKCPGPEVKCWVSAEELEDVVMRHLFETFGNPVAVAKAIEDATPNDEKIQEALRLRERKQDDLVKAKDGLQRILELVIKGVISDEDTVLKVGKQKAKIQAIEEGVARLEEKLSHIPAVEKIKPAAQTIAGQFRVFASGRSWRSDANRSFDKMTYEEKRKLCQMVFGRRSRHNQEIGVSIRWITSKKWRYRIEGEFIEAEGGPMTASQKEALFVFGAPHLQKALVTKNSSP